MDMLHIQKKKCKYNGKERKKERKNKKKKGERERETDRQTDRLINIAIHQMLIICFEEKQEKGRKGR